MMNTDRKHLIIFAVVLAILAALLVRSCGRSRAVVEAPIEDMAPIAESTAAIAVPIVIATPPPPVTVVPAAKKNVPSAPAAMTPPAVQIHPELIPKNIEIVRVYYASMITGPASSIEFDINGSGFTKEFEKMITVESGQPNAAVKGLSLVTPNQIHGTLLISDKSATMVSFPRVLIKGKVVFQAPEPFAVIRPGEVLNMIFTEMGESGRSGRFRVFTNLDQEMFQNFSVTVNTPTINVTDLTPQLPFIVDGVINIGPAVGGEYDIDITLKGKNIWHRKGIIRVVRPNVGQSGLVQKVLTQDGYHRPGDTMNFSVHGSGFQPGDVGLIRVEIPGAEGFSSTFTYASPGRLELAVKVPAGAAVKAYGLKLLSGQEVLQEIPDAFRIVDKNWTRVLRLDPALTPGGASVLSIVGRDLTDDYVSKIKVELDEPKISIGAFFLVNPQQASAPISAGADVKPGDYLLKMTSDGKPVSPEFGSIIRVSAK